MAKRNEYEDCYKLNAEGQKWRSYFEKLRKIDPRSSGDSSAQERKERTDHLISFLRTKGVILEQSVSPTYPQFDNYGPGFHLIISESIKDWEAQVRNIEDLNEKLDSSSKEIIALKNSLKRKRDVDFEELIAENTELKKLNSDLVERLTEELDVILVNNSKL